MTEYYNKITGSPIYPGVDPEDSDLGEALKPADELKVYGQLIHKILKFFQISVQVDKPKKTSIDF